MAYRVILWGLGTIYNRLLNLIKLHEVNSQITIVGVTANEIMPYSYIDGYRIINPKDLENEDFDYCIILNEKNFSEILSDLENQFNISHEKVLSYKMLQIPNLNIDDYLKLKDTRVSIFSNNCWGGIVYNYLGLECLSPFKNLFLKDEDYIKLLRNPEIYINAEPKFKCIERDIHSSEEYPVLSLMDIELHCNHLKNQEEAIHLWNKRRKKINWNSLFVEMYTENQSVVQEFLALKRYNNKICFVPWRAEDKNVECIQAISQENEFYEVVNKSGGVSGWKINLVDLLLGRELYERVK